MQHYYQNIGEDWFNYSDFYKLIVDKFDNATFVEIGSWKGRSSIFMAVEIINSNKNIKQYCVDTWKGSAEHIRFSILNDDGLYHEFLKNIEPVNHVITPVRMKSLDACNTFEDGSLDFIFIDASHEYDDVKQDIEHWYPKVKSGGIIAGHDYDNSWFGVVRAVNEWSSENNKKIEINGACWFHHVF